jgi:1,4-dihydroxy-2-naphthoyl-CoA hydrolase
MVHVGKQIWKQAMTLEALLAFQAKYLPAKTIHDTLGVKFTKLGDNFLEATMPVDDRTRQPYGILHGGASVVLAESLGSFASVLVAGPENLAVGIEVSASHLKSISSGSVTGRVRPIRLGKSLHVWEIKIHETDKEEAGLVCHSKLSVIIRPNSKAKSS